MSNDTRFWLARGTFWGVTFLNSIFLTKLIMGGLTPGARMSKVALVLFGVTFVAMMVALVMYYHYRAVRWTKGGKSPEQIEVEMLAQYGAQLSKGQSAHTETPSAAPSASPGRPSPQTTQPHNLQKLP